MRKFRPTWIFFLSISILVLTSQSANSVWNGESAIGHKRAVAIFPDPSISCGASGFLYSPRIVFTVAHTLFLADDRSEIHSEKNMAKKLWVGIPGEKISPNSKRIESIKFFWPENYASRDAWLGGKRITRNNDFAVLVLKEPLPVDNKKVELLTPEQHNQFISSQEVVTQVGYGSQKSSDVGNTNGCMYEREPKRYESSVTSKNIDVGNEIWTAPLNFKVGVRKPNGCDGDSGSGYFIEYPDKYLYFGAMGAGSKANHNCESYEPFMDKESINGSWPVYLYLDLIKEAEDYVAANPYVAPVVEKTIKCVKGKKTKKITAPIPKCPTGYKQK